MLPSRASIPEPRELIFETDSFHPKGTFLPVDGSRVHHLKRGLGLADSPSIQYC